MKIVQPFLLILDMKCHVSSLELVYSENFSKQVRIFLFLLTYIRLPFLVYFCQKSRKLVKLTSLPPINFANNLDPKRRA